MMCFNNASLVFQFVRGADPILKLHDENNDVKEVLRCVYITFIQIISWTANQEFTFYWMWAIVSLAF